MRSSVFYVDVPLPSAAAIAARAKYQRAELEDDDSPPLPAARSISADKGKGREVVRSLEEENDAFLSGADWLPSGSAPERSRETLESEIQGNGNGDVTMADADDLELDENHAPHASTSSASLQPEKTATNGLHFDVTDQSEQFEDKMARSSSSSSSVESEVPLARRVRLVKAGDRALGHAQHDYEQLDKLPIDTNIAKILARNLLEDGTFEYVVRLDDTRIVKVCMSVRLQFGHC